MTYDIAQPDFLRSRTAQVCHELQPVHWTVPDARAHSASSRHFPDLKYNPAHIRDEKPVKSRKRGSEHNEIEGKSKNENENKCM